MSNDSSTESEFEFAIKKLITAFPKLMPSLAEEIIETFNEYLAKQFGSSSSTNDFSSTPGKINKRSGDLIKSFELGEGSSYKATSRGLDILIDSNVKYAASQNFGDKIQTTTKMEKFFWAKYMESRAEMWKIMALYAKTKGIMTIRATHYFDNAIKDFVKNGMDQAYENFYREKFVSQLKKLGLI